MSTTPSLRCLVLNAGGTYLRDKEAAVRWARTAATTWRPDLAFIQEVPSDEWIEQWRSSGYDVIWGHQRGWKVRSAILTLLPPEQCTALDVQALPELKYHGDYVAAARLVGWLGGRDVTLLSVHAQPAPVSEEYLRDYEGASELRPREGGADPRDAGKLFDADVVLETVRRSGPDVLACGDLNEARGWDTEHPGHTWGEEFFGRLEGDELVRGAVQAAGLVDIPLGPGLAEVPTRRAPGHPSLQLDHLLAGPDVAPLISDVSLDPAWREEREQEVGLADHAPIWFTLGRPSA